MTSEGASERVTSGDEGGLPPASDTAVALSSGAMGVAELVRECRARIDRFNPVFHAFSHLASTPPSEPEALQRELSSGRPRSPLHGFTVGVKGNIPVARLPWTEGSAIFAHRVAAADAAVVARARRAGGIVLGCTTLSELAMYGVRNSFETMAINPWNPERTAGGSTAGGGVAACLGMATVNIGTDSGGSIRNPACHAGAVGFMASNGALPVAGVPVHVPSFPGLGLIARSLADTIAAYTSLRTRAPVEMDLTRRLLVPMPLIAEMCDDETAALFSEALRRLERGGFTLIECDIASWQRGEAAAGVISHFESARTLARFDPAKLSDGLRARRDAGLALGEQPISDARRALADLSTEMAMALDRANADALVSPTWPFAAPPIDAGTVRVRDRDVPTDPHRNCFVRAANAAGAAALTLPMGLYPRTCVPAGLHLMTASGRDDRLLAAGSEIEALMPRLPTLPCLSSKSLTSNRQAS